MGSDRARVSYDEQRRYRSVVAQQGRVSVEADFNEAWTIAGRDLRERTLDIVGPSGTPDDGYAISPAPAGNPPYDFVVGPGTMYVGGERAVLFDDVLYSDQPEWLDHSTDPDWVSPSSPAATGKPNELIWLWLSESEVSAVEDLTLRDVALGGVDTAQRTRLVQRFKRFGTAADDCSSALEDLLKSWDTKGWTFDPETMRLTPEVSLEVTFPPPSPNPDLCEPDAAGGYLEADNQLIRVMITQWNGATGKIVWGFDNASFLYRVSAINAQTMELQARPVDAEHQPAAGQAVEVLRSAVRLSTDDFIASPAGVVQTLALAYNPDTQRVSLPSAVPADYTDTTKTPQLFLRVWEQELQFTPGIPLLLGSTGVQVTLEAPAGGTFAQGAYWMFAVRPSTPQRVYPERYLEGPQPPDGPVVWLCPLSVVTFGHGLDVLEDCRNHFEDLVDLTKRKGGGCCDVVIRPEDVGGGKDLQALIDTYLKKQATICLMPGRYELTEPIRLNKDHEGLTLEGCHDGAVITAAKGSELNFVDGLIVLNRTENVTIKGLRFLLPRVPFAEAKAKLAGHETADAAKLVGTQLNELDVSIGIRPLHAAMLTVQDCLFRFTLTKDRDIFGAGIFAGAECWGHRVERCRFLRDEDYLRIDERPFRMLFGYLLSPTSLVKKSGDDADAKGGMTMPALLSESSLTGNRFTGLAAGIAAIADCGSVRIDDNTVRESYIGFLLAAMRSFVASQNVATLKASKSSTSGAAMRDLAAMMVFQVGLSIARAYPLPDDFAPDDFIMVGAKSKTARRRSAAEYEEMMAARSGSRDSTDAQPSGTTRRGMSRYGTVGEDVSALEAATFERQSPAERGLRLQLHVGDNDVDAYVPGGPSGVALAVMDDAEDTASDMTVVGNRMRTASARGAAAMLWYVDRGSVTGNTIANEGKRGESINIYDGSWDDKGSDRIAVAGNLFRGRTQIPPRPHPAPLDTWDVLNAVM